MGLRKVQKLERMAFEHSKKQEDVSGREKKAGKLLKEYSSGHGREADVSVRRRVAVQKNG